MRQLFAIVAAVLASSHARAYDAQIKAQLECENAAHAQYKKEIDALYDKISTRPITVQEVMANRRITEAYCLRQASCTGDKRELLGQTFESCLDGEAQEHLRQLDELHSNTH